MRGPGKPGQVPPRPSQALEPRSNLRIRVENEPKPQKLGTGRVTHPLLISATWAIKAHNL